MEKDPNNQRRFEAVRSYWSEQNHSISKDKILNNVKRRILEDKYQIQPKTLKKTDLNDYSNFWFKIAISIVMISIFSVYFFQTESNILDNTIHQKGTINKKNPNGQKSTIFLSDGSIIHLNSGSSVSYVKGFNKDKRQIELSGEAYFEVAQDISRPFTVRAHGVTTIALGTMFNVNAYSKNEVTVSLAEGKVQVEFHDVYEDFQDQYLVAGEQVEYNRDSKTIKKGVFNPKINAWKDGVLYFENASEKEVFEALELWYGLSFSVSEPFDEKWHINASYDNQNLASILASLGYIQDFDFEILDKKVLIKNK
jgi:ferric-dicitrate binding protein FerR (iron transport regulator)